MNQEERTKRLEQYVLNKDRKIAKLEDTVKHLILSKQEEEALGDPFNTKETLEDFHKRDQEHKTVFQKFLHWMAG